MSVSNLSHYISDELTDPRTMKWALIPSPLPLIYTMFVYLFIVYIAGPRFMKDRKPYSLKGFVQCYNIFQVVVNFWVSYSCVKNCQVLATIWRFREPFDNFCEGNSDRQLEILWWGLLVKLVDLIESIVFILRKKTRQLSILHVAHHVTTVFLFWSFLRYFVHGYILYAVAYNYSIHVIMYSYYFLSALGSEMQQRLLPFKKCLTIMQMVQFVLIVAPCLQAFTPDYSKKDRGLAIVLTSCILMNMVLFYDFYKKTYSKKSKTV